jgi:hypothetical protein
MQCGLTGRFEITAVGDERIRAFVPYPLPPLRQSISPTPSSNFSNAPPWRSAGLTAFRRWNEAAARSGLSFSAAAGVKSLAALGIVSELTGKKRNRVFAYDRYLALLTAGT